MKRLWVMFWTRLRFASVAQLSVAALLALFASLVLDHVKAPTSDFLTAVLFGLAAGLAIIAFGVWQRRNARA